MKALSGIKRIAISTGGGDAPGLNAVIRAVVLSAVQRGWECYGIRDGFNGILEPKKYPNGGMNLLTPDMVRGIGNLGGTILGTTNNGNPMRFVTTLPNGDKIETNRTSDLVSILRNMNIDALICVGGDGSLTIAHALHQIGVKQGLSVIGVPKTIDNDLDKTYTTFGFDSAVSFATDCIDRLHSTAESHHRIMVVEVMGRYAGWIALSPIKFVNVMHLVVHIASSLLQKAPYPKMVTMKLRNLQPLAQ
jgi:6-phosphofructokinase